MNIARPMGEKPALRTGGKRQEAPEECKLHGIKQETDNPAFEGHGTEMVASYPDKGFAFVTLYKPAEAETAM